jgi:hypothetical protein
MKLTMIAAAAATLMTGGAFAADSTDRTSMPNNCSDRNANCVIQDGPPRGRGRALDTPTTRPSAPPGTSNSSGTPSSKGGNAPSGSGGGAR